MLTHHHPPDIRPLTSALFTGPWDRTCVRIECCPNCGYTPLNDKERAVCPLPQCGKIHRWEVPNTKDGGTTLIQSPMARLEVPVRKPKPLIIAPGSNRATIN